MKIAVDAASCVCAGCLSDVVLHIPHGSVYVCRMSDLILLKW